jgi:hypothetical protein
MAIVSCRECNAAVSSEAPTCLHCGCPSPQPVSPPLPLTSTGKVSRLIYLASIATGLLIPAYLYLIAFNSFSETALVKLTPAWVFPLVFGYYGFVAQRLTRRLPKTPFENVADLLLSLIKETQGVIGKAFALLIHAPFIVVKSKQPLLVALGGAAIWALILFLFFSIVFPTL